MLSQGYANPCLKQVDALWDWMYGVPRNVLYQVGPHTLFVATMHYYPQLPTAPYSGCLTKVHLWTWENQTYRLMNFSHASAFTRVQWERLHDARLGISLEPFRSALNASKELKQLVEDHKHKVTQLKVATLMAVEIGRAHV